MATRVRIQQPDGVLDVVTLIPPMTIAEYADLVRAAGITVVEWFEDDGTAIPPPAGGAAESSVPWWAWIAGGYVVLRLLR